MTTLPPLLATYDGADFERRGDAVYRVEHATGRETRWCHASKWNEARDRLEAAAKARRVRITVIIPLGEQPDLPPKPRPHRNNGRKIRHKATPEIIERLQTAPVWQCASCGCHDGRRRSLKDGRYCKQCARRRPIAGAQADAR